MDGRWINGLFDGWMDGWMDEWMDGCSVTYWLIDAMDRRQLINVFSISSST